MRDGRALFWGGRLLFLFFAVLVLGGTGCDGGRVGAEPAASELGDAICDATFRCCSRHEVDYYLGPFTDEGNCSERIASLLQVTDEDGTWTLEWLDGFPLPLVNVAALDHQIRSGRIRIVTEVFDACLLRLAEFQCNVPPEDIDPGPVKFCPRPPEDGTDDEDAVVCDPDDMFDGLVPAGHVCTSDLECEEGLFCYKAFTEVEGVCVARKGENAFCWDDDECESGLYCAQLDGTCKRPGQEGEPCAYSDRDDTTPEPGTLLLECDKRLSCDPVTDRCVPACERGAACTSDAQCDDDKGFLCIGGRCDLVRDLTQPCSQDADCKEGLRCELDTESQERVCVPQLAAGEECFDHGDCLTGYCDQDGTGTCQEPVPVGGTCDPWSDSQCVEGAYCEPYRLCSAGCPTNVACNGAYCASHCAEHLPDGAECQYDGQCESGTCAADYCRTFPLPDGQLCDDHDQCRSGFCNYENPRACAQLPLPLGSPCFLHQECASWRCHDNVCVTGLPEGEACGPDATLPCARDLYCDDAANPSICTRLLETGAPCDFGLQCRSGSCSVVWGRRMCTEAPPPDEAICNGKEPPL